MLCKVYRDLMHFMVGTKDVPNLHYSSKVLGHLEISLFLKEKQMED